MTIADQPAARVSLRDLCVAAGDDARLLAPAGTDRAAAEAVAVTDVTHDSTQVAGGVLFACRPGARTDGHDFASSAVDAGAPALLVQRPLEVSVPQIVVGSVAAALGAVAATVHGHPSREMTLIGVTGTNGKTTTAYLLEAVLAAAGHTTGLIGTVETRIAGARVTGVRTTPESTDLQRLLRRMRDAGVTGAAMEVSSHGLALGRVTATRFTAAAFTNLTQDHLDFHADMEDYYRAKRSLFDPRFTTIGVVNVDDDHGRRLADEVDIGIIRASVGTPADVWAADVHAHPDGATFTAQLRTATVDVRVGLPGLFNVSNALLALAAAEAVGIDPRIAAEGIAACRGVPGRMERVDAGQPFTVLVDYAHTPDSLANVLGAVRAVSPKRVIVVVGCGGERDAGKRPLMGRIAAELADLAVFTNDNPRSEDPRVILDAVVAGAAEVDGGTWVVEPDRRAAIGEALTQAGEGDVVVVAGKGHETTQEIDGQLLPFDDRAVVRDLLGGGS
ncbi:MAG TPA: UDP-N-acetylmuramoyl-L-alanyl-D-glutamate--2,6-diaminopimelate ligase [Egibacteraceae bacterium]|nr:UDP-N-acetylmuramoyl-L-alanyl-D-glutamate--2,6-diaminopimelate ligase [Egibacteraceae bacterium]